MKDPTQTILPRIDISPSKIRDNTRILSSLYGLKGISLMGVTKAVLGEPAIARAMIEGGCKFIADSRIENIQRMKLAGITTGFVLLRTPPSQAEVIVENADISMNTELETLQRLSYYAREQTKFHNVILMVEMGDLREGILPCDLPQFIKKALPLPNIKIIGLGCNLACHGGIIPDSKKMEEMSNLTGAVEMEFNLNLEVVSGGNSANYDWYQSSGNIGRVNNLRLGESILLGLETITRKKIPDLHTGAFKLVGEVIESKNKPSLPFGEICQDAFGNIPRFRDRGVRKRGIVALGRQDILASGCSPENPMAILGVSSDHIIFDNEKQNYRIGDEVRFDLDYGGLLAAMTSPFIYKNLIESHRTYKPDQMSRH